MSGSTLVSLKERAGESEKQKEVVRLCKNPPLGTISTVLLKQVTLSIPLMHCQTTLQNNVFKEIFLVTPTVPATLNSTWCIHSIFLLHTDRVLWISSFRLPARCCSVCPLLQQYYRPAVMRIPVYSFPFQFYSYDLEIVPFNLLTEAKSSSVNV